MPDQAAAGDCVPLLFAGDDHGPGGVEAGNWDGNRLQKPETEPPAAGAGGKTGRDDPAIVTIPGEDCNFWAGMITKVVTFFEIGEMVHCHGRAEPVY